MDERGNGAKIGSEKGEGPGKEVEVRGKGTGERRRRRGWGGVFERQMMMGWTRWREEGLVF